MRFCKYVVLVFAAMGTMVANNFLKAQTASFNFAQLDVPNSASTEADGINTRGDIIGFFVDASGKQHGFLDQHGTFTQLDFPKAASTKTVGINNENEIVGAFTDASGVQHGSPGIRTGS